MSAVYRWGILLGLVLFYGVCYAPYGINETDGGFLTGLAWQVLSGKTLYHDVVYVRPPLPVWLRCLELQYLPESWALLGERCIFYGKVAIYSLAGACVLADGERRWWLAWLGFVVSVHCYPPAAWHTTDGIFFGVLSIYLAGLRPQRPNIAGLWAFCSGISLALALGCKQSFYPLLLALALAPYAHGRARLWAGVGFAIICGAFAVYLLQFQLWTGYWAMTGGAASGNQAIQHGILDYGRIQPLLAGFSAALLMLALYGWHRGASAKVFSALWFLWLLGLVCSYGCAIYIRQDFTVPFAQSRLLFDAGVVYALWRYRQHGDITRWKGDALMALLLVSWCASISWGYNLPILFATPWVFAAMDLSRQTWIRLNLNVDTGWAAAFVLVALLGVFRYAYTFIYRDGLRSDMRRDLGGIFPKAKGIYTDDETFARYEALRRLSVQYGPGLKTLPAFPQASFLLGIPPALPLDWVVEREMGARRDDVWQQLLETRPVMLIDRALYDDGALATNPEFRLTREMLALGVVVEKTRFFVVVKLP